MQLAAAAARRRRSASMDLPDRRAELLEANTEASRRRVHVSDLRRALRV